jgi:hypothetical protein
MSGGRISGVAIACFLAASACSSSSDSDAKGTDGGDGGGASSGGGSGAGGAASGGAHASGGAPGSGGAAPGSGGAVTCGGEECKTSPGTGTEAYPCCTTDGACGVKLPISVTCLPRNQFGTVNQFCDSYDLPGPITLPGCCGSDGCGARMTTEGLGCISNTQLGRPKVACNQSGEPVDGG